MDKRLTHSAPGQVTASAALLCHFELSGEPVLVTVLRMLRHNDLDTMTRDFIFYSRFFLETQTSHTN